MELKDKFISVQKKKNGNPYISWGVFKKFMKNAYYERLCMNLNILHWNKMYLLITLFHESFEVP